MAARNDKYMMFKNFMYNELGISKEDIRGWIQDAVHQEAKSLVYNTYNGFNIKEEVKYLIKDEISDQYGSHTELLRLIAKELSKELEIKVK